jgi:Zn-dependent protease with chaperone function/tetratricopeptide (TPR) repeat protein
MDRLACFLFFSLLVSASAQGQSEVEFDLRILAELRQHDPEAADLFDRANAARDRAEFEEARDLYRRVRHRAPWFHHATRRLCGVSSELGRDDEAISLCEEAVGEERSIPNLSALATVLARRAGRGPAEIERAKELVREAVALDPEDRWARETEFAVGAELGDAAMIDDAIEHVRRSPRASSVFAQAAISVAPHPQLKVRAPEYARTAVELEPDDPDGHLAMAVVFMDTDPELAYREAARTRELAPADGRGHYVFAITAAKLGKLDEARDALELAREHGLAENAYAELDGALDDATPVGASIPFAAIGYSLLGWFVFLALLIAVGAILSRMTLALAERVPDDKSGRATGGHRFLRAAYRVVLTLTGVFFYLSLPLLLLGVLAGTALLVYGFFFVGRMPINVLLFAGFFSLVTIYAVGKAVIAVFQTDDRDPGTRLDLRQHPSLRRLLDDVATKLETRPVDSVYLTPATDVAVTERGSVLARIGKRSERCLILGVGVLEGMKVRELKAVLAHEYGHFKNEDTAGGDVALAVRKSLGSLAIGLLRGGAYTRLNPAWWFVIGYHRLFLFISHGASRLQEILADRWAAVAYGGPAFESGLRHVIAESVRFDARSMLTLDEVIQARRPLKNLYRYEPERTLDAEALSRAIEAAIDREPSIYDSHPRPRDRFKWVHALDVTGEAAAEEDTHDAWTLFTDREKLELSMTAEVRSALAANAGVVIAAE